MNENNHDLLGVVGCVFGFNEGDNEANGLPGRKAFSVVQMNAEPERLQHLIERLDTVEAASTRAQVPSWSALSAARLADCAQCKPLQGCEDGARRRSPS
jgi:hypothetical protein